MIHTKGMENKHFNMADVAFPSLDIYQQQLAQLGQMDLDNFSPAEIADHYFNYAMLFPLFFNEIEAADFNGSFLYRVRKNISDTEDKSSISPFTYPPTCSANGRANIAGTSVFYACDDPIGAIKETRASLNEPIYLSVWRPNIPHDIISAMFIPADLQENNLWKNFGIKLQEFTQEKTKEAGDFRHHLNALNTFVMQRYMEERAPYPLTSWISNKILFEIDGVDMITYPSIATEKYRCNVAIHPSIVNDYIVAEQVFELYVTSDDPHTHMMGLSIQRVGELADKKITWRTATADDAKIFRRD